jgi:nuclear cap-binding protein subunit 1
MSANDFIETDDSYPQPSSLSRLDESLSPFELPSILVPPDVIELELDGLAVGDDGGDGAPPAKKEEWPEFYVRLFENDVSTSYPTSPVCMPDCLYYT